MLIEKALANGSTDNLTALCAWLAPISVLEAPEIAEEQPAATSLLVPLLAGAALIVIILAVLVLFLLL